MSRALEESGAPLGRVVTGFVEGELLLAQGSDCPLASVNGGAPHCLPGAPDERLIGVHAVDGTMLWTLWEDREIGYLYRAGSGEERWARRWQMEGEGAFEALITGTRGVLVLAERHQLRVAGPGFSLRPLLAPPGPYLAVWSGPEVPVWVGTADGRLLGFDGLGWTERSTPAAEIQHLSGAEERLYFASDTLLGRLDASGTPETLVEWSEATPWRIRSIHASQISDEVDLVVEDRRSASLACGGYRVMAHDGERLRAL